MSSSPAEPRPRPRTWPDSLFARLLLLQVGVALGLFLLFTTLVYVERNVAVARLVGERWAPSLREAAGWPAPAPAPALPLLRSAQDPEFALHGRLGAPRLAALDDELQRRGVTVLDVAVGRGPRGPVLWLQVLGRDGRAQWLGLADGALLPAVPRRILLALLLAALLLVAVSWWFTRRLTRPLELLRQRMQDHQPGTAPPATAPAPPATPEIAAIGSTYDALLARLERHDRERALLLAGVSHDLRAPLARIRMAADLLPSGGEGERWREAIVRNTEVADRLVGSFLDHVRSGELPLDQPVDVAEVAHEVAAARGDAGIVLDAARPALLPRAHPLLVERLIDNLVDNALKHGVAPVGLRVHGLGGRVRIEVSDAGTGIPPAERERLLQAFARGDAARGTPGTGLGLAVVERIVARLGGQLVFEQRDARHVVAVELPPP